LSWSNKKEINSNLIFYYLLRKENEGLALRFPLPPLDNKKKKQKEIKLLAKEFNPKEKK
jgi:hypothetical protein